MTLHRLFVVLATLQFHVASTLMAQTFPPQVSPLNGGSGGDAFTRSCGSGRVLSGVRGRSGILVDAIGILCRAVLADGTLGPPSAVGSLVGGSGGTTFETVCPSAKPVVIGMELGYGTYVNFGRVRCATWQPDTRTWGGSTQLLAFFGPYNPSNIGNEKAWIECEKRQQPANALRGRAHSLIDAIGLTCDEP